MIEPMNVITEFVNATLNLYVSLFFFSSFWKRKFGARNTILIFFAADAIFTCSLLFFKGNAILYIPMMLATVMVAIPFESKLLHKFIFSIINLMIMGFVEMIVAIVLTSAFSMDFNGAKQGILYIVGILLSKFVAFIITLFIRLRKHKPLLKQFKKNYFGILLFPLSTLVIMILQHYIFLNSPNQGKYTYYAVLIAYSLLFFANIIVFDFIDALYRNTVNESKVAAANELIASQTEQYHTIIDHNKDIQKIQHDNKNFCIGLISDLKEGRIDEALSKLQDAYNIYTDDTPMSGSIVYTLINLKRKATSGNNIEINFENHNLPKIVIPSTDLAILLGNALDNAIEECERIDTAEVKTIDLFLSLKNDTVIIIIKNPTAENIDVSTLTTKKLSKKEHGFGIISMKQIAAKYGGDVIFSCENKIFTTSIILNNNPNVTVNKINE